MTSLAMLGSLMMADGKMIIMSEKGDLVTADASPEAYQEISRVKLLDKTCWVVPVLANGQIYCRNNLGEMVCVDVSGN